MLKCLSAAALVARAARAVAPRTPSHTPAPRVPAGVEPLEGRRLLSTVTLGGGVETTGVDLVATNPDAPATLAGPEGDQATRHVRARPDGGFVVLSRQLVAEESPFGGIGGFVDSHLTAFDADGDILPGFTDDALAFFSGPDGDANGIELDPEDIIDMQVDGQGRTYLMSEGYDDRSGEEGLAVIRLAADGTLDTAYGYGGVAYVGFADFYPDEAGYQPGDGLSVDDLNSMAVTGDGVAYLNVSIDDLDDGPRETPFALFRIDADGSFSQTFGNTIARDAYGGGSVSYLADRYDGMFTGEFGNDFGLNETTLVVDGDRLYVAGERAGRLAATGEVIRDFAISAHDLTTGLRDRSFGGGDGYATIEREQASAGGVFLADFKNLDAADGRLFAGFAVADPNGDQAFGVVALTGLGEIDAAYGEDGLALAGQDAVGGGQFVNTRFIGADGQGRVLFAGETFGADPDQADAASVIRFDAAGQLDTAFGDGGVYRQPLAEGALFSDAAELTVLDGGAIIVAGQTTRPVADGVASFDGEDDDVLLVKITVSAAGDGGVTVTDENGELLITGTADADDIAVTQTADGVVVTAAGESTAAYQGITYVEVDALAGDDLVTLAVDATVRGKLIGGEGNDTLVGGAGGDAIGGGAGDDVLYGGGGMDLIVDLLGDNVVYGGGGRDAIKTGDGADLVYGDELDAPATPTADGGGDLILTLGGNDTAFGGAGCDVIYGGDGADDLRGGDGNDFIHGGDGPDTLFGDAGFDILFGGDGDDSLVGGAGWDLLIGGRGDDTFAC